MTVAVAPTDSCLVFGGTSSTNSISGLMTRKNLCPRRSSQPRKRRTFSSLTASTPSRIAPTASHDSPTVVRTL